MKLRRLSQIILALLAVLASAIGLTSINHPIILKWVTGSARHHGKPIETTVYTNGQVNDKMKVFYTDEPNSYMISFSGSDSSGANIFFNININENWIGSPAQTSKDDYDFIAGHLFQSKTGESFFPFKDEISGQNFDPQFSSKDRQIRFTAPPDKFGFDSVRVEFD